MSVKFRKTLVSPGTVGAVNELIVANDLMIKGFEVYRNLSPNGSNDIVAFKDGKFYGIDVKSGHISIRDDKAFYDMSRVRSEYVAVVVEREAIHYFPELDEW